MSTYYNEIDPFAANWLRNLIKAGLIAPGDVDERSIEDVAPTDFEPYTQCHFFAGIGGWSYALRLAGWPDDRPVWTGSCPCQPFSAAGKGEGFADERHLWPSWFWLVRQSRPGVIFGEQVASKLGLSWFDVVSADLESQGYTVGAVDLCAAGVGAPHKRQRLWFVADAPNRDRRGRERGAQAGTRPDAERRGRFAGGCAFSLADGAANRRREKCENAGRKPFGNQAQGLSTGLESGGGNNVAAHGFWSSTDWLTCRDGKARPVESGTQQMVDGLSRAMGRLCYLSISTKEEMKNATTSTGFRDQVVRAMREGCDPQEVWQAIGRCLSFPQATVLLAYLCEQSGQLGDFFNSKTAVSPRADKRTMRAMRSEAPQVACSPSGWELSEQCARKLGNIMSELSSGNSQLNELLTLVSGFTGIPLARDIPARVGRLRGYGNAIVPQVAAEFVKAYMEMRQQ